MRVYRTLVTNVTSKQQPPEDKVLGHLVDDNIIQKVGNFFTYSLHLDSIFTKNNQHL